MIGPRSRYRFAIAGLEQPANREGSSFVEEVVDSFANTLLTIDSNSVEGFFDRFGGAGNHAVATQRFKGPNGHVNEYSGA